MAVKFSEGGITGTQVCSALGGNKVHLRFDIEDTGIGIQNTNSKTFSPCIIRYRARNGPLVPVLVWPLRKQLVEAMVVLCRQLNGAWLPVSPLNWMLPLSDDSMRRNRGDTSPSDC